MTRPLALLKERLRCVWPGRLVGMEVVWTDEALDDLEILAYYRTNAGPVTADALQKWIVSRLNPFARFTDPRKRRVEARELIVRRHLCSLCERWLRTVSSCITSCTWRRFRFDDRY